MGSGSGLGLGFRTVALAAPRTAYCCSTPRRTRSADTQVSHAPPPPSHASLTRRTPSRRSQATTWRWRAPHCPTPRYASSTITAVCISYSCDTFVSMQPVQSLRCRKRNLRFGHEGTGARWGTALVYVGCWIRTTHAEAPSGSPPNGCLLSLWRCLAGVTDTGR